MRKFLAIILLSFITLFGADNNVTQEDDIISITNQIQTINSQINIIKSQQKDLNASKVDNSNLITLQNKKNALLKGFHHVASAPLARSSYRAWEALEDVHGLY